VRREAVTAVVLAARSATGYGEPVGRGLLGTVPRRVSAFNNAGFALYRDNVVGFATDPMIMVPMMVAMVAGGLGFPVLLELGRRLRGTRADLTIVAPASAACAMVRSTAPCCSGCARSCTRSDCAPSRGAQCRARWTPEATARA
jgi:Cation transport protein